MRLIIVGILFVAILGITKQVSAEMTSTNFMIRADGITTGGDNTSSSSSYLLRDSVSQTGAGISSSSSYSLRSGLRPMLFDQIVTLDVGVQEIGATTSVSALSGLDIAVSSASGFSVGDLIVLIEDESTTHLTAVGKITSIAGSTVTVDQLVSNGSPSIDGTDDALYRANGTSVDYGTLSSSSVAKRTVVWEVSVDVDNGFVVYIAEGGNFVTGSNAITDVSDGTVTAGSREYGARSSDTTLASSTFDTEDTAITTTPQQIATVASGIQHFGVKGAIDLKVAIDASITTGTYDHDLYLIAAPTY